MSEETSNFEIKAATGGEGDVAGMFSTFMSAFEQFKQTNDARLAEIERRGRVDVLTEDKLERLNAVLDGAKSAIDRQALDRARPRLEGGRIEANDEYKQGFAAYVKRGEEKALSIGSNPDGGYLVPAETETEISRLLTGISPIRAIASVRQVSSSVYRKPVTLAGPAVGWVAETAARPQTASQTIDALDFPTAELYAMPAATSAFLDDAAVDVGQWIAEEVNAAFAAQETAAFIGGNGVNKPRGFLDVPQVAEADWAWESLGYVATGEAGAFPDAHESDVLIDLVYALKAGYRQNANWVMNRRTQGALRKLKDADGNYLWQPAASPGGRASLMGFELVEAEDMPDIGAGTTPIAFGDFRRGYLVVDRQGVNVLRDPYSAKPYVLFYTTKRVGGGVQDFDAIKLLKFAAE
ncbi:phage major capsid protein [Arsenicitalea aurantiaca]|uniref:Phage major capsid protein n=1 Tax=Arsenicitalea aurantiaca TaxID=1783274 RepID=A0A433XAD8_9HYPH|nr:phage major capsid protein [Arsenicitalea aurantiaca]RUT31000.1 phage major capsid protein [Arsenicitalea aurantiaca]